MVWQRKKNMIKEIWLNASVENIIYTRDKMRAVFCDRDGTTIKQIYRDGHISCAHFIDEVELLPGVAEGVRILNVMLKTPIYVVVISNQPDIAKGYLSREQLRLVTERMTDLLSAKGAYINDILYCEHKEEDNCDCRKPKIGLLLDYSKRMGVDLKSSFLIGDSVIDVLTGQSAGCTTFFIGRERCDTCKLMEEFDARPDYIVPNFLEAVNIIKEED